MEILDPQNKQECVKKGNAEEPVFIRKFGCMMGIAENPEKERNPFAPDLIRTIDNRPAELKCQSTPFFRCGELYGLNPNYATTINRDTIVDFARNWPDAEIYFWIRWETLSKEIHGKRYQIDHWIHCVANISLQHLLPKCTPDRLHPYKKRVKAKRHHKDSYVVRFLDDEFSRYFPETGYRYPKFLHVRRFHVTGDSELVVD